MLSEPLNYLEEKNNLSRILYDETPMRVEYELTQKGYALRPIMEALSTWSLDWYK